METGIELIAKERKEQLTKHGRTVEYDVMYNNKGQLGVAASALAHPFANAKYKRTCMPLDWAYSVRNKMATKPYKEQLIIAGALIAAELDRLIAIESTQTTI